MYEIVDNFLSDDDFSNLQDLMLGPHLPWFYNDSKLEDGDSEHQFTHLF